MRACACTDVLACLLPSGAWGTWVDQGSEPDGVVVVGQYPYVEVGLRGLNSLCAVWRANLRRGLTRCLDFLPPSISYA